MPLPCKIDEGCIEHCDDPFEQIGREHDLPQHFPRKNSPEGDHGEQQGIDELAHHRTHVVPEP